jgi:hypothetical protein
LKTCKAIAKITGKRCSRKATNGPWCISHDPKKKAWRLKNAKKAGAASRRAKANGHIKSEALDLAGDTVQFQAVIESMVRRSLRSILGG